MSSDLCSLTSDLSLPVLGVVFDLDGTLVDSGLDFDAMRREMGLAHGQPLLESLAALPAPRAAECHAILARHEQAGADRASLMPGAAEFVALLHARGVRHAVFTRNSRGTALATLARLGLSIDLIYGREDAPPKPDPAAILQACEAWGLPREQVVIVGDYMFDLEAGRRAGIRSVLYTAGRDLDGVSWAALADFRFDCFTRADALLAWLGHSDASPRNRP